jgi:shikimate kinase
VARLVLVGLPGTGKTTVARDVARRWNRVALDTDELVAAAIGESPGAYLRRVGESDFRAVELTALRQALEADAVVSTGGGVVTTPAARALLAEQVTIWLDGTDELIASRLDSTDRPLLGDDPVAGLRDLRLARESLYREVARARVDVEGSAQDVTQRVIDAATEGGA